MIIMIKIIKSCCHSWNYYGHFLLRVPLLLLLLLFFAATSSIINSMTSDGLGFKGLYKVLGLSGVEGFPGNLGLLVTSLG